MTELLAGTVGLAGSRAVTLALAVLGHGPHAAQVVNVSSPLTLYKATDLATEFTLLEDDLAATPPLNTYTDAANTGQAFYIISVR